MKQPNILFILTDQMRADCTGFAGHPVVRTAALDDLATRGTWFANAFSTTPICVPARAQLLTGRWGHETGNRWRNNSWRYRTDRPIADNGVIVDPEVATLPELLTLGGYVTAAIGKCHYYPRLNPYGFTHRVNGQATGRYMSEDDEYLAFLREAGYEHLHMDSFGVPPGGYNVKRPGDPRDPRIVPHVSELPSELQFTRWCTDRSIEFLERAKADRPFFLQVGYHAPHDPYCVSRGYDKLYDPEDMRPPVGATESVRRLPSFEYSGNNYSKDVIDGALSEEEQRLNWSYYLANITFIDEQVGRLLEAVEKEGRAEDTIVVFTSDHGDHMGDHGLYGKSTFWEESIKVPLVVAAAGAPKDGTHGPGSGDAVERSRNDELVTLMDLFPTFLDMAGLEIPGDLRNAARLPVDPDKLRVRRTSSQKRGGKGTNPVGLDEAGPTSTAPVAKGRRYVFGEFGEQEQLRYMVRSQRYKYIVHPALGLQELYDLYSDPNEVSNLLDETAGRTKNGPSRLTDPAHSPSTDADHGLEQAREALAEWIDAAEGRAHPGVPSMWPDS